MSLYPVIERLKQKYRTIAFPKEEPILPDRFVGKPHISSNSCLLYNGRECSLCRDVCPTGAINIEDKALALDTGLCTFCAKCANACMEKAITFTREYALASTSREGLLVHPTNDSPDKVKASGIRPVGKEVLPYFKRSFKIREVSAAGCNACEADCNVLGTIVFDLPRFGIDYLASPRHADAMMVSGPVPENMQLAIKKCYAVIPTPKVVIAVGACAISGGLFRDLDAGGKGLPPHFKVDLFIPGCPPHPITILDGLLRFIGKK